jgi:hypothetical protein
VKHFEIDVCTATPHGQILLTPASVEGRRHVQMVIAGMAIGLDPQRAADPADLDVSYASEDCQQALDALGLLTDDDTLQSTGPTGRLQRHPGEVR